jgi:hypothetical protein
MYATKGDVKGPLINLQRAHYQRILMDEVYIVMFVDMFAGSRYVRRYVRQQTATARMLQFSSRTQPRLSKADFANTDEHSFIEHIHQVIRDCEEFDWLFYSS